MIWLGNVSKSYEKGGELAVDRLQLQVKPGEIFGFLGPNGAGKTTTIKMVTGILRPDEGEIEVDGVSMVDSPLEAKGRIGYVPDQPEAIMRVTGWEYLRFIADVYGVSEEERKVRLPQLLERYGMEEAVYDLMNGYSRGMKQKLAVIASLIHDPAVWILDEPMVGLDPQAAMVVKEEMKKWRDRGKTIFFSTHVLEVAERLCDRVAILQKGQLMAVGTMDELKQGSGVVADEETLERLFLELTGT
ncbi:ABC-2 type transport system ATP-binding protein [Marininema mesophilum]|uniref:ABC-2 type transport system ATP-binding protein n=1 Tax=Marininema mesophilum TaxID=1048340 RepID=A0A1H2VDS2_9BACL|nr:ABC transporter ATP-binding protein [Marininema mesophilum]SDW66019.1 ABC-2 type transport system ATP-binding protein [Marininema mesophilum]